MPIIDIRALAQTEPELIELALKNVCTAVAQAYGCEPRQVWATWISVAPGQYYEGDVGADVQPSRSHPPIVRLLCFEGKDDDVIENTLKAASEAICRSLRLTSNVFIEYAEAKSGRVIAGNGVIRH